MTLSSLASLLEAAWLLAGVVLGIGGVVLRQRVLTRQRAEALEWDPY